MRGDEGEVAAGERAQAWLTDVGTGPACQGTIDFGPTWLSQPGLVDSNRKRIKQQHRRDCGTALCHETDARYQRGGRVCSQSSDIILLNCFNA